MMEHELNLPKPEEMLEIPNSQWEKIPDAYKGCWTKEIWELRDQDFPKEWIGRRTVFEPGNGTTLITEGVHFRIVPDAEIKSGAEGNQSTLAV